MRQDKDISEAEIATFGAGVRKNIGQVVDGLGKRRALVLSTPAQSGMAMDVAANLGATAVGVFARATMHTPVEVTHEALDHLTDLQADCLVSIGGGSTVGLGKALAYRTDLPHVAIPTTYAGSEATPILGQTEDGQKTTLTDPKVRPIRVLYDPELITGLPLSMTVTSGLNAMAHAAEALYAENRSEASNRLAQEGFAAFVQGLPRVMEDPSNLDARLETQKGAWACGCVLGQVGMALHHKLCHTLGGSFGLPHAETHAIILPHAIAYNARSAGTELQHIADILGATSPGTGLHDFAQKLGAPMALKDLGLTEADLPRAAHLATQRPYPNPHPVTEDEILILLKAAWAGNAPPF